MLRAVERVVFFVEDVERAVAWYQQILAGEVDRSGRLPTVVVGDVQFAFHPADPKTPPGVGGTVPYCGADSIDAVTKKLVDGGAALYRGPLEIEDGRRICQIKDPFGNVFGLVGL